MRRQAGKARSTSRPRAELCDGRERKPFMLACILPANGVGCEKREKAPAQPDAQALPEGSMRAISHHRTPLCGVDLYGMAIS